MRILNDDPLLLPIIWMEFSSEQKNEPRRNPTQVLLICPDRAKGQIRGNPEETNWKNRIWENTKRQEGKSIISGMCRQKL